jgi:DNA primase
MCPFCHHQKKKFAVNSNNLRWHCWHCGAKGGHIIWLLKKLNLSKDVILRFKDVLSDVDIKKYKSTTSQSTLFLPSEYKPMWVPTKSYQYLHAVTYLQSRGIRSQDVLRYRIGYCEEGPYAGRIIVPSYDSNNQLNYFTARSYFDGGMKYKNPPVTKNIVAFENLVNWNEPIVLCEGMFDAITLRRNAIPLLGKTLPKNLERALLEHKVKEVIIFLDNDAQEDAIKMEHKLQQYEISTKLVITGEKDASEIGFEGAWESIEQAEQTQFKQFITQRLYNI